MFRGGPRGHHGGAHHFYFCKVDLREEGLFRVCSSCSFVWVYRGRRLRTTGRHINCSAAYAAVWRFFFKVRTQPFRIPVTVKGRALVLVHSAPLPECPPCCPINVHPGAVPAHQRAPSARHAGLAEAQVRGLGHGAGAGGGRGSGSTRPRLSCIPGAGAETGDAAVRGGQCGGSGSSRPRLPRVPGAGTEAWDAAVSEGNRGRREHRAVAAASGGGGP